MSKPIIAIDFDDTLVTHVHEMVDAYNQTHEDFITVHDIHFAQKVGTPKHGWNHSRKQAEQWIFDYLSTDEALATQPIDGAVESLSRLKERYRLMIVTGRSADFAPYTQPWIDRFMPDVFEKVNYAGDRRKSVVCNEIGAETMIDDSPVYLADCIAAGIRGIAFGSYEWNGDKDLPEGATRARTWREVEELLG
ncbi:hypothetical protein EPO04_02595 [Patescibacteria group bacterium]|nr:MAG: hypothetical protein EPO04_02595 [Patescibacteria group bacterium]